MKFVIYKYTFDNGKCYIGQTNNIKIRIDYYKHNYKKQPYAFYRALYKYGFDIDRFKIIDYAETKEQINNMEIYYIHLYDSNKKTKGYNLTEGGGGLLGKKHTDETKRLMSEKAKGKNNAFYGKHHTEETKKIISEKSKLKKPSWLGKKHTNEYKINMSINHSRSINIICNETGKIFSSIRQCAKEMKLSATMICYVIKGTYKQHHGYTFKIIDK
jgi:group I intron endonuclease